MRTQVSMAKKPRRKRKGLSPGKPSNQLPPSQRETDDGPTPETVMQMAFRLGAPVYCDLKTRKLEYHFDPQRGASALSLLLHRGLVPVVGYRAGVLYGLYRYVTYGRHYPRISRFSRMVHEQLEGHAHWRLLSEDERMDQLAEMEAAFCAGDDRLKLLGRWTRGVVRVTCIDGLMPRGADELPALNHGLLELADAWRIRR